MVNKMMLIFLFLLIPSALACGGRDIVLTDTPQTDAVREQYSKLHGMTFYYDAQDNLLFKKEDVLITKQVADSIVESYLDKNHPEWESYSFESFDLEHGRPVYMYEAHAPDVAVSYHVGSVQFVTDHLHLHVDVVTGELLDVGCGGGPSKVLSQTLLATGEENNWDMIAPEGKTYFYTENVLPEGSVPVLDGIESEGEWEDALEEDIHIGSTEEKYVAYGCGGSGKTVRSNDLSVTHVEVKMKEADGMLYVLVEHPGDGWLGLMLKDFAHHGMIGDFGDVKILADGKVEDYFLSSNPESDMPVAKQGLHGCYSYAKLVPDAESNVKYGVGDVYEFAFPLNNEDPGDSHWTEGAYQIAFLYDKGPFRGITETTKISTQENVRVGEQLDYEFRVDSGREGHGHGESRDDEPWWHFLLFWV